jgi:hypothetical protein
VTLFDEQAAADGVKCEIFRFRVVLRVTFSLSERIEMHVFKFKERSVNGLFRRHYHRRFAGTVFTSFVKREFKIWQLGDGDEARGRNARDKPRETQITSICKVGPHFCRMLWIIRTFTHSPRLDTTKTWPHDSCA